VANEPKKRHLQKLRDAEYWAKEDEKRRLAGKPSREELLLGARARREEMFRGPQKSLPFGHGPNVKSHDEPKSEAQKAAEFELRRARMNGTAAGK
jgi:hypothetical protein